MVSELLGFIREIVWVNTDAVATDESWCEFKKIPFCRGGLQDRFRMDAHFMTDHGEFICKSDIDIPLCIFNDFCRFGNFYRICHMDTGINDGIVYCGYFVKSCVI